MAYTFQHGDRPLEGYAIQRAVGQGGFGEVYYAISDGGREVALKYLKSNPEVELRGVSQCMNLKSPHLVSIFDVKQSAEGDYFIVMEYISGPSLRDLLVAEPNGLGPQKAAYLLREIGKGLSYLHDRGIVHRDLKPGNIFYEDGYVKIGDYGLSKFISVSRHSAQTASVGTVHYMAPEVGSGNYSRGIDIYALGVMFYEMLLGRVPFEGSSMGEVLMKHLTAQPEVDELPARFGEVIRKALAKDVNDRYATVEEMVEDVFGEEEIQASMAGFNPSSLSGVARRATAQMQASPVPSPNPRGLAETVPLVGRGDRPNEPRATEPVRRPWETAPERLGKRLTKKAQRIDSKIQRKMDKLAGRESPRGMALPKTVRERRERMVLSGIMAVGLTVGVAILFGASGRAEEVWITSALLVPAMSGGLLGAHAWLRRMASRSHPNWARRVVTFGCCLPLMAIACAPMLSSFRFDKEGVALLGALLIVAVMSDWRERLRSGARGELSVGSAISVGLFGLILAAIFSEGTDPVYWQAGVVAAAVSLIIQAFGWLFAPLDSPRTDPSAKNEAEGDAGQETDDPTSGHVFGFAVGGGADAGTPSSTAAAADHVGSSP
ncbi:MAG: protein kinase, partial [Planctomycetes bacterium]|nr:protein kinase [Planctomycetota bacterium]